MGQIYDRWKRVPIKSQITLKARGKFNKWGPVISSEDLGIHGRWGDGEGSGSLKSTSGHIPAYQIPKRVRGWEKEPL